mmetsp:Transcript_37069/g.93500  ORF Transcript_37069/g.93500 Transcript_37069/m.93500 type:complete len:98 (-) Transcript_37069:361-654(-)|eukprot:CAMPEP_0202859862 /NCGR_PEP_ID=MMETSP1391-20130828/1806_1 /ASSEMBLY_ACC=CAM_ASM_000867 /TAXON_ID=1034604 /ORGANISM="Chlamydomonas leiostraca, Strain SAG 11-49" /LENGTH=97 /DNA_ID=CAMNT_0049538959 /DNA_START=72 /DNA_END=365 /DNA_ORIENTATION=+
MTTDETDFFGATFAIEDEDHTLANSLRFFLNKNPQVSFCGYSMPHPTEEVVNIRVQTTGEVAASQALRGACEDLKDVTEHMLTTFKAAVQAKKAGKQ